MEEALIYRYDGSFEGLLCCIFESYAAKEMPADIIADADFQGLLLFREKRIVSDETKANRVLLSMPEKLGSEVFDFVRKSFLTCLAQKEMHILRFLRLAYREGRQVMQMLQHEAVNPLFKAVRYLERESHLFKGFVRFSDHGGILTAEIDAKNCVLPLLVEHFCARFPEERFIIHDKKQQMALVYQPYEPSIIELVELTLPQADANERDFRLLWQTFYRSVAIESRHNPRCRMSQMPKRYWKDMTEFATVEQ